MTKESAPRRASPAGERTAQSQQLRMANNGRRMSRPPPSAAASLPVNALRLKFLLRRRVYVLGYASAADFSTVLLPVAVAFRTGSLGTAHPPGAVPFRPGESSIWWG